MQELIRAERVAVDHPLGIGQVLPGRLGTGTVYVLRVGEVPVILIQQQKIPGELDGRDDVALAVPRLPVQKLFRPLGDGRPDGSGLRRCRRYKRVGGGALLLCEARTRCHEGEGEERPKELAGMLGSAHPRLVAEPALGGRLCLDYWMRLTN
jgi:hypothetical protein